METKWIRELGTAIAAHVTVTGATVAVSRVAVAAPVTLAGAVLFTGLGWHDIGLTLNRVALGVAFAITGTHKTLWAHRHLAMVRTLTECLPAWVPSRAFVPLAWFVGGVEMMGGLALIVGLLSPLAALGLLGVCIVATCTDGVRRIPAKGPEDWADCVFYFLYLPEVLWAIMLLIVIFSGPGAYSLDAYIAPWLWAR